MKKKIVCILAGLLFIVPLLFSVSYDISGQVSPIGFMNFSVWTKYKHDGFSKDALKEDEKKLSDAFGVGKLYAQEKFVQDSYNAYTIGADFRIKGGYVTLNVGFPRRTFTDVGGKVGTALNATSFIFSGQIGGGMTFFRSSPFNLFLGAGVGFDFVKTTRKIESGLVPIGGSDFIEERLIGLLGIGINVGARYYFVPHVGIFAGITDNLSLIQMANQRYYRYTKAGIGYLYYVNSKEEQKDIKKMVSALVANNVAIRLGIALKL